MSEPQVPNLAALSLSLQEKHEYVLKECDRLISHFKTRADRNKYLFKGLKYFSITLTIGVTVLAAWPSNPIPWTVPVVAGLAALCTTMLSATHAQELWVLSRNTEMNLQVEKFDYCQGVGAYCELGDEDRVRKFSERFTEIWRSGHKGWQENVSEKQLEDRRETSDERAGLNPALRKTGLASRRSKD